MDANIYIYVSLGLNELIGCDVKSRELVQGSFLVCTQPIGDYVTLYRRFSLAGRIHKMISAGNGFDGLIIDHKEKHDSAESKK